MIVTKEKFDSLLKSMIKSNVDFVVEEKKSSKCLLINEKLKAKYLIYGFEQKDEFWGDEITFKEGLSVYANILKELNTYIDKLEGADVPKVKKVKLPRKINNELWKSMEEGKVFYAIDMDNCWFQMAYRLGYINYKTYNKWSKQNEYKRVVQRFLPMASSKIERWTFRDGARVNLPLPFKKRMHMIMYENVRNAASEIMEMAISMVDDEYIYVNTDEIAVLPDKRVIVANLLDSMGIEFKLTFCKKINKSQYLYAGKVKNFKYTKPKKK